MLELTLTLGFAKRVERVELVHIDNEAYTFLGDLEIHWSQQDLLEMVRGAIKKLGKIEGIAVSAKMYLPV